MLRELSEGIVSIGKSIVLKKLLDKSIADSREMVAISDGME